MSETEEIKEPIEIVDKQLLKDKKSGLRDISLIVGMYLLIAVLIICIVFMVKYKNEITTNPLSYGMKLYKFESCSCFDTGGKMWIEMNGSGFIHEEVPAGLGGT